MPLDKEPDESPRKVLDTPVVNAPPDPAPIATFPKASLVCRLIVLPAPLNETVCPALGVANKLWKSGFKVVGVPKTIDNDLSGTDYTFGFDTAVNIAMDAIDRIHTTAESHKRVMIIEVMGRHAGWIAMHSGLAAGADIILIPEREIYVEQIIKVIQSRLDRGRKFSIVVVAEGAKFSESDKKESTLVLQDKKLDEFGHVRLGGISNTLADVIEKRTGIETRATILGHIQRGGSPTAYDRVLGTRFGVYAVEMINDNKFGRMAALKAAEITGKQQKYIWKSSNTIEISLELYKHNPLTLGNSTTLLKSAEIAGKQEKYLWKSSK